MDPASLIAELEPTVEQALEHHLAGVEVDEQQLDW